jgi:hypothetical protein
MSFSLRLVIWFSAVVLLARVVDTAAAVLPGLPLFEGPVSRPGEMHPRIQAGALKSVPDNSGTPLYRLINAMHVDE